MTCQTLKKDEGGKRSTDLGEDEPLPIPSSTVRASVAACRLSTREEQISKTLVSVPNDVPIRNVKTDLPPSWRLMQ